MDDLVEFLKARYAEERIEAEKQPDDEDYGLAPWAVRWEETGEWNSYPYVRVAKARVLAEVEGKRAIVDDLTEQIRWGARKGPDCQDGADACERTLKRLALPYSAHPDYRPEWAPGAKP